MERQLAIVPVVIGSVLMIVARATNDVVTGISGVGLLILGIGGLVLYTLNQIRVAINKSGDKVETVLKQRH